MTSKVVGLAQPAISYVGLERANKVVRLMARYYWPLYDWGLNEFLDCHPVLSFIAAVIHQTDDAVEQLQKNGRQGEVNAALIDGRDLVLSVLSAVGATDAAVAREIERGGSYLQKESRMVASADFTLDALREVLILRSSDLRLLHRLSLHILHRQADPGLFSVLEPLEVMAEIRDDLYQYDEDRAHGGFNTYALLERKYGSDAPLRLQEEREYLDDLFQQRFRTMPANVQRLVMPIYDEAFDAATFQPPTCLQPCLSPVRTTSVPRP